MSPDPAVLIVARQDRAEALARSLGAGFLVAIDRDGRGALEALLRGMTSAGRPLRSPI